MKISIKEHNPDPLYLRKLIEKAGVSQREAARRCGVDERTMRRYLADIDSKSRLKCPYPIQFCLENL